MSTTKLGSLLKFCDLYGEKPCLLYDKAASLKTHAGAFSSILGILGSVACTVLVGYMYFNKTWNAINVDTIYEKDPVGFKLDADTLPFGIALSDAATLTPFMDPTIYELQVIHIYREKQANSSEPVIVRTRINTVPCNETQIGQRKSMFADQNTDNIWCLEEFKVPTGKLNIRGQFTSDNYGGLLIDIVRCSGSHCKDEATITAKLNKTQMALFYSNSVLQASDYQNPIKKYDTLYYTDVSPLFSKEITMNMKDHEIRTQSSITSYMPYHSRYVSVASDEFSTSLVEISHGNNLPQRLIRLVIQMDGKKLIINRSYQTLFEVLAVLGGVFKLFSFVCFVLSSIIAPTVLKLDLALKISYSGHSIRTRASGCTALPSKELAKPTLTLTPSPQRKLIPMNSNSSPRRKFSPSRQQSIRSPVSHISSNSNHVAPTIREVKEFNNFDEVPRQTTPEHPSSQSSANREDQLTPRVVPTIPNNEPPSSSRKKLLSKKSQPVPVFDDTVEFHEKVKKVSFCAIFLYCFMPFLMPKNAQIRKIVDHMDKNVMNKFDFMNLLNMMDDIEKLRFLLLSDELQASFEKLTVDQIKSGHASKNPQDKCIRLIDMSPTARR
jgi:hypothetical protein